MRNKKHHLLYPMTAFLLSSVMLSSCGAIPKVAEKVPEKTEQADSVKELVPLHPPVVIPHSWKETK